MFGLLYESPVAYGIGFGIAAYGLVYFLVHDVLIHRIKKWFDNVKNPYLKAVLRAYKAHHKNRFKEQETCFGMHIFRENTLKVKEGAS